MMMKNKKKLDMLPIFRYKNKKKHKLLEEKKTKTSSIQFHVNDVTHGLNLSQQQSTKVQ